MDVKNTKRSSVLMMVFIVLLILDLIIDPSNLIFKAKYFLFVITLLLWIFQIIRKEIRLPKELVVLVLFISFFMPLYALSVGLLNNFLKNTNPGVIVYFSSFFFFTLTLVIVNRKIDLTKPFNIASLFIVLITIGFYGVMLINPLLFGSLYHYFVIDKQVAIYALRDFGGYPVLQMFYKTSPLLVFPLSYYLYQILIQGNVKLLFLKLTILLSIIVTLFLSGTRANIVSLALIILFYLSYYIYKKSKIAFVILTGLYTLLAIYGLSIIGGILFNATEISNLVKFGHFISYIEHFSDHIGQFIFGNGLGSSFYSYGINRITNVTELTYLELIRIWGMPISIIFLLVLITPVLYEIKAKQLSHLFIAYIAYLFIAGTNPLLLSSTGMIVLVYVFSNIMLRKTNDCRYFTLYLQF
ncbi:MAG: hypothetical protein Q8S04_04705 [Bacteroidales bacterium]|nr:hypothetical protein [Bacteroidales bacterium]